MRFPVQSRAYRLGLAAIRVVTLCGHEMAAGQDVRITTYRESGGQVHWSPKGPDRIAYAARGSDGYFDVHLADPDGSHDVCLTSDVPRLPHKHLGSPSWHPARRYIVLVAEKDEHPGSSVEAIPGFGAYSDIWCLTPDGKRAYRLTNLPADADHGVLLPRFSPDGKRLVWTGRVERPNFLDPRKAFGYWAIHLADFVDGAAGPRLSRIRTLQPGGRSFYEAYGFSPNGKRIIFCSSMNQPSVWDQQIYTMDAAGGNLRQLTRGDYNEHASYTPDGRSILWMSNRQSRRGGTDWWIMNADGTNQRRLTYFNEPGHPHDMGRTVWAGLGSFSPDGRRFVGDIQTNLITQEAMIKIVELAPEVRRGARKPALRPGRVPRSGRREKRSSP